MNWTSYLLLGGESKELTNTLVRTTYIRDIKIEREHASENLCPFGKFGVSGSCDLYIPPDFCRRSSLTIILLRSCTRIWLTAILINPHQEKSWVAYVT
jgi:hypothetical protein